MYDHEELLDRQRKSRRWPPRPRSAPGAFELRDLDPEARRRRFRALVRSDRWTPEGVASFFGVSVGEVLEALREA